jgi:hypothetical protein
MFKKYIIAFGLAPLMIIGGILILIFRREEPLPAEAVLKEVTVPGKVDVDVQMYMRRGVEHLSFFRFNLPDGRTLTHQSWHGKPEAIMESFGRPTAKKLALDEAKLVMYRVEEQTGGKWTPVLTYQEAVAAHRLNDKGLVLVGLMLVGFGLLGVIVGVWFPQWL